MALRSLDNALPLVQERPKKQAKVSVAAKLNAVNDENVAPLPPVTVPEAVDYVASDDLEPLDDPDLKIQVCVCVIVYCSRYCFRVLNC